MTEGTYKFAETPAPAGSSLFFTFHGTGGDESQFHGFAEQQLPESHVISPRGDVSEAGHLRYFRRTDEGMYDMADLALRTAAMANFVSEHGERLDAKQVLGLGYSNGANILTSTMFLHPQLFDIAILLHPLIPFEPLPQPGLAGVKILMTAGKMDPICPPEYTNKLYDYLEAQDAQVSLIWHDGGHEISREELEDVSKLLRSL